MALRNLIFGAALTAAPAEGISQSYGKYESPPYSVTASLAENVELRDYGSYLMADVRVNGGQRGALNQGFRVLAGYIFGGNTTNQSVAMTSPVAQSQSIAMTSPVAQSGADGMWTVSFMMPRQFTIETLPTPNNAAVTFRQVAAHQQVVISFSGRATPEALDREEAALRRAAQAANLSVTGPAAYYFYDDPMTLPWRRRNEVALRISD